MISMRATRKYNNFRSTRFNNHKSKTPTKVIVIISLILLIFIWLISPPRNKIAQICYIANHIHYYVAILTKPREEVFEWAFHRNNALYLSQMNNKKLAQREITSAIRTAPNYLPENKFDDLYTDCALFQIYIGDYKGALNNYLRVKNLNMMDNLRLALLHKEAGSLKYGIEHCKNILNTDPSAYIGYACYADLYSYAGRPDISVKIFNVLIDRYKNRAMYYVERAKYKKESGDLTGYEEDMVKVKELSGIGIKKSELIEKTIKPQYLDVEYLKY